MTTLGLLAPILNATTIFTQNDVPAAGGFVYTYEAGTTTNQATYTTINLTTPQTNPIVLNSAGQLPYPIWLEPGVAYKFQVTDASNNVLGTYDNISGVPNTSGNIEWVLSALTPTYASPTTFTVPGNQVSVFTNQLRVQATIGSGAIYGTVEKATYSSGTTTVTVTWDSTQLDSSVSAIYTSVLSSVGEAIPGQFKYYVNITDPQFGAIGDGTTDASTAILAAIATGATQIFFPAGTYLISNYSILSSTKYFVGPGDILYNSTKFPAGHHATYNFTLPVPSVFQTINDAVAYLDPMTFDDGLFVNIQVADGTYSVNQVIPNFVQGENIGILGNQTTPTNVVLNFNTSGTNTCGFYFRYGVNCGNINGFYIQGNGWNSYGSWVDQSYGAGIRADWGSQVNVGGAIQVNKHYYGIQARWGSKIQCQPGVQVFYAGDCGFHAYADSAIYANGCKAFSCADTSPGLGFGFCSEGSSFMDCSGSNTASNAKNGFYALSNGSMWAHGCEADHNGNAGFAAIEGGMIEATDSCNSYDNLTGYYTSSGGFMNCNSALATTNTGDGFLADLGSRMDVTASSSTSNTGNGYHVISSSTMEGSPTNAYQNTGIGVYISNGAVFNSSNITVNNNATGGVWATQNAQALIPSATVNASGGHGIFAQDCSSIFGNNIVSNGATNNGHGFYFSTNSVFRGSTPSANNNGGYGYYAENNSFIQAPGAGGVGNTAGFDSPTQNSATAANKGSWIVM